MKICRVVNKYHSDFDVNIQRGTMWGNYVGKDCDNRPDAIAAFKDDFIKARALRNFKRNEIRMHLQTASLPW